MGVMVGAEVFNAVSQAKGKANGLLNKTAKRLAGESGQSEWVATALKVGIGLAAAGLIYALVSGPLAGLLSSAGSKITGLPGSAGGSLP